jgi:hypothetical protein
MTDDRTQDNVNVRLWIWPDKPAKGEDVPKHVVPSCLAKKARRNGGFSYEYQWNVEQPSPYSAVIDKVPSDLYAECTPLREFCAVHDDASILLVVSVEGTHHATAISHNALAAIAFLHIDLCTRHDFYVEYFNKKHRLWMPYTTNIFVPDFPGYFYKCGAYTISADVVRGLSACGVSLWMEAMDEGVSCHASVPGIRVAYGEMGTNGEIDEWMTSLGCLLEERSNRADAPQFDAILILIGTNCEAGGFYLPPSLTTSIARRGIGLCLATVLETMDEGVQLSEVSASQ